MNTSDRCIACAADFHWECYQPDGDSCCCPVGVVFEGNKRGGPVKENDQVTDVLSTGRKRAAVAFPLDPHADCEWRGLKFAGGGFSPIVGCVEGKQVNRHHGPDKSVLNNEIGNVHRICATCHNRWHARNDEAYGERPPNGLPFLPRMGDCLSHDGETKATDEDIVKAELEWFGKTLDKVMD